MGLRSSVTLLHCSAHIIYLTAISHERACGRRIKRKTNCNRCWGPTGFPGNETMAQRKQRQPGISRFGILCLGRLRCWKMGVTFLSLNQTRTDPVPSSPGLPPRDCAKPPALGSSCVPTRLCPHEPTLGGSYLLRDMAPL